MSAILETGPALEPVSLAEAKAHLRLDAADEDMLLASLITAARMHVEVLTGQVLITQSWRLYFDAWPDKTRVEIPIAPLQAISSVTVYDAEGVGAVLPSASWLADVVSNPGRLVRNGSALWPDPGQCANGIEILLTAGHGDAAEDVPQTLRQAILLLAAHWFETREPVALGRQTIEAPHSVAALLAPMRRVKL